MITFTPRPWTPETLNAERFNGKFGGIGSKCLLGNHEIDKYMHSYSYHHEKHNIEAATVCDECLLPYVEYYFGDCPVSRAIRDRWGLPSYHGPQKIQQELFT